jgi:tRNA(Ile2) C34 agmatinyltransferase TiaS
MTTDFANQGHVVSGAIIMALAVAALALGLADRIMRPRCPLCGGRMHRFRRAWRIARCTKCWATVQLRG